MWLRIIYCDWLLKTTPPKLHRFGIPFPMYNCLQLTFYPVMLILSITWWLARHHRIGLLRIANDSFPSLGIFTLIILICLSTTQIKAFSDVFLMRKSLLSMHQVIQLVVDLSRHKRLLKIFLVAVFTSLLFSNTQILSAEPAHIAKC